MRAAGRRESGFDAKPRRRGGPLRGLTVYRISRSSEIKMFAPSVLRIIRARASAGGLFMSNRATSSTDRLQLASFRQENADPRDHGRRRRGDYPALDPRLRDERSSRTWAGGPCLSLHFVRGAYRHAGFRASDATARDADRIRRELLAAFDQFDEIPHPGNMGVSPPF